MSKQDEKIDTLSDPPIAPDNRKEDELLLKINTRMQDALKGYATEKELEDLKKDQSEAFKGIDIEALRELADKENGVLKMMTRQSMEVKRLKDKMAEQPLDMSVRAQCTRWMERNNDGIKNIVSRKKGAELEELELQFEMRTNNPMLPANSLGGSVYLPKPEFQVGIIDILRPQPTFWDYIRKGTTSSATYVWVQKKNPLGAAAWIAPGVYKPNISFTVATANSNAKKIAANEKMAIELLEDIDGFVSWVEDELIFQVKKAASLTLMTGVSDSVTPAGIQTLSVPFAFVALGLKTTNANGWDVIRASVAQLRIGNYYGSVTAFMNPADYANMVMTKAINQGQTFIPPVTGATIVEDNNIPKGYIQIAILDNYKILIYKPLTITWGLENDDFTKNLRTVIGEMRLHQFSPDNLAGSFIYDTIANGVTYLNTP